MSPAELIAFLCCAFAAEVIGTMAGFGAATILTPVAALFMDMKTAIAVVAGFHLFGNASRLRFFGRHVDWRIWWQFGLTGVAMSLAGAFVTSALPSATIMLAFGIFLLAYVALSVAAPRLSLPKSPGVLAGGGAVSGFIAGMLGTGGAVRSACLMAFGLPKEAYIGTSAAIALVVDATRLPVYAAGGLLSGPGLTVLLGLMAVAFAGAWAGQRLVRRVSAGHFRAFVLVMLGMMGAKMVWDGVRAGGLGLAR
jgi:uncharacterized membrane protein YfcA